MTHQQIIDELFSLADTSENASKIKPILNRGRWSKLDTRTVYRLYDLFEDSVEFKHVQARLARL